MFAFFFVFKLSYQLKVHGPTFQNLVFNFIWWNTTPMVLIQNYGWNGQAVWMYEAILYIAATYRSPFSYCIDQAGLGAFTAKNGRKHYNPPPLTVMWMNFDSPIFLVCVCYQQ